MSYDFRQERAYYFISNRAELIDEQKKHQVGLKSNPKKYCGVRRDYHKPACKQKVCCLHCPKPCNECRCWHYAFYATCRYSLTLEEYMIVLVEGKRSQ